MHSWHIRVVVVWGECSHVFHMHCLLKWIGTAASKQQCPMDRRTWGTLWFVFYSKCIPRLTYSQWQQRGRSRRHGDLLLARQICIWPSASYRHHYCIDTTHIMYHKTPSRFSWCFYVKYCSHYLTTWRIQYKFGSKRSGQQRDGGTIILFLHLSDIH